ncbi:hypothetical protein BJY52DRAFT_1359964 [Lactarius psammicola]|nr:hypothetical protein BJY52DRAFT_1359964 [Lactarius psammicola]
MIPVPVFNTTYTIGPHYSALQKIVAETSTRPTLDIASDPFSGVLMPLLHEARVVLSLFYPEQGTLLIHSRGNTTSLNWNLGISEGDCTLYSSQTRRSWGQESRFSLENRPVPVVDIAGCHSQAHPAVGHWVFPPRLIVRESGNFQHSPACCHLWENHGKCQKLATEESFRKIVKSSARPVNRRGKEAVPVHRRPDSRLSPGLSYSEVLVIADQVIAIILEEDFSQCINLRRPAIGNIGNGNIGRFLLAHNKISRPHTGLTRKLLSGRVSPLPYSRLQDGLQLSLPDRARPRPAPPQFNNLSDLTNTDPLHSAEECIFAVQPFPSDALALTISLIVQPSGLKDEEWHVLVKSKLVLADSASAGCTNVASPRRRTPFLEPPVLERRCLHHQAEPQLPAEQQKCGVVSGANDKPDDGNQTDSGIGMEKTDVTAVEDQDQVEHKQGGATRGHRAQFQTSSLEDMGISGLDQGFSKIYKCRARKDL